MRKCILYILIGLILLVVIGFGFLFYKLWQEQPQMFVDARFDIVPPELVVKEEQFSILVFSKTNGFRHKSAISAGEQFFKELAEQENWQIVITENAAIFNEAQLSKFDVVIWNNATGPLLTAEQRIAMRDHLSNGAGFVGVHAAGDASHGEWPWYQSQVIRAVFTGHPIFPPFQKATLRKDKVHPVTEGLPAVLQHKEEWYSFAQSPRQSEVSVLYTVDEKSYKPGRWINGKSLTMGDDHPVAWAHRLSGGRVVYIAPGHRPETFDTPWFQKLLAQSIKWAGAIHVSGS